VQFANDILLLSSDCEVVGIDEAQFFDDSIVDVANKMADAGKRVIIAGLDMDYSGKPFYPFQNLMAIAEHITKMHAICMRCGALASYSYRTNISEEKVVLGETDLYEARCRKCFNEGMKKRRE
jgi:thymidine kinase